MLGRFALTGLLVALSSAAYAQDGAQSPRALVDDFEVALGKGEPWRLIDFVLPEDRAPIAFGFDRLAFISSGGEAGIAALQEIEQRYGVKTLTASFDDPQINEKIAEAYAGVTDYHGLAADLWGFLKDHGGSVGDPPKVKLLAGGSSHPKIKLGKQALPLVMRDGRWYIDAPDMGPSK